MDCKKMFGQRKSAFKGLLALDRTKSYILVISRWDASAAVSLKQPRIYVICSHRAPTWAYINTNMMQTKRQQSFSQSICTGATAAPRPPCKPTHLHKVGGAPSHEHQQSQIHWHQESKHYASSRPTGHGGQMLGGSEEHGRVVGQRNEYDAAKKDLNRRRPDSKKNRQLLDSVWLKSFCQKVGTA